MRRILSLALLALALPFCASAQQANDTPTPPPSHGTPQGDSRTADSASTTAKPAKKTKHAKTKPASHADTTTAPTHGTPQGGDQK